MKSTRLALAISLLSVGSALMIPNLPTRAADIAPSNSRQALGIVVSELNVDGVALSKVIDFLRNVSGTNLVVDWKTLETAGVQKDASITLQVKELTLRKMLQLVLSQASPNAPLSYSVDANVIQITTQEALDKQLITKVYIVDDLVMITTSNVQAPRISLSSMGGGSGGGGYGGNSGGYGGNSGGYGGGGMSGGYGGSGFGGSGGMGNSGMGSGMGGVTGAGLMSSTNGGNGTNNGQQETSEKKGQELVDLIKNVIRPNIWTDNGGPASIKYFNGKLIVTAPVSVQEAIGGPVGEAGIRFGM